MYCQKFRNHAVVAEFLATASNCHVDMAFIKDLYYISGSTKLASALGVWPPTC